MKRKLTEKFSMNPVIERLAKYIFNEILTGEERREIEADLQINSDLQDCLQSLQNARNFFELENYQQFVGFEKNNYFHEMEEMQRDLEKPVFIAKQIGTVGFAVSEITKPDK